MKLPRFPFFGGLAQRWRIAVRAAQIRKIFYGSGRVQDRAAVAMLESIPDGELVETFTRSCSEYRRMMRNGGLLSECLARQLSGAPTDTRVSIAGGHIPCPLSDCGMPRARVAYSVLLELYGKGDFRLLIKHPSTTGGGGCHLPPRQAI